MAKNRRQGFSLIEVLVALALASLVLGVVLSNSQPSRKRLDEELSNFERFFRFATDEAALKNSLIRIYFDFEKNPFEYGIQEGPKGEFTIPLELLSTEKKSKSLKDEELEGKKKEKIAQAFKNLSELEESKKIIEDPIRVVGLGSSLTNEFHSSGTPSLFFYTSGERDAAILILASDEEIATLKVNPFTMEFTRDYYPIEKNPASPNEDIQEVILKKGFELYSRWLKE